MSQSLFKEAEQAQTAQHQPLLSEPAKIARKMKEELDKYVVGNDEVKTAVILGFLTGYPVLLIGDPGTAKTYTIELASRMIEGIQSDEVFITLAHEAMTPEDIFGNIDMKKLREEGVVKYITKGFLPTAKVVFIDEIFKGNKTLAQSLFRAINEKKFRNGMTEENLPWIAFFSASNEIRMETQADRAFLDRFRIFATTLSPNVEDAQELKNVAERYFKVLTAHKPKDLPKVTSYETLKKIQEQANDLSGVITSIDQVNTATQHLNAFILAIAEALQRNQFDDPYTVEAFFKSMGGYFTVSERRFKSLMQLANALRMMFGNKELLPIHYDLAYLLGLSFLPKLREVNARTAIRLINEDLENITGVQSTAQQKTQQSNTSTTMDFVGKFLNNVWKITDDSLKTVFMNSVYNLMTNLEDVMKSLDMNSDTYKKLSDVMKILGTATRAKTRLVDLLYGYVEAVRALENLMMEEKKANMKKLLEKNFNGAVLLLSQGLSKDELVSRLEKLKQEIDAIYKATVGPYEGITGQTEKIREYAVALEGVSKFFPFIYNALDRKLVEHVIRLAKSGNLPELPINPKAKEARETYMKYDNAINYLINLVKSTG